MLTDLRYALGQLRRGQANVVAGTDRTATYDALERASDALERALEAAEAVESDQERHDDLESRSVANMVANAKLVAI